MIGHNNGPLLEEPSEDGGYVALQTWRNAYKAARRPPSLEVMKLRAQSAEALGMTYRDYNAVLMDRGRSPRALFFDLAGTLVRTRNNEVAEDNRGSVTLMPGVREKLSRLRDCSVFVVTDQAGIGDEPFARETVENYIHQVSDQCGGIVNDYCIGDGRDPSMRKPAPGMILRLLKKHRLVPGQGVMIGDEVKDEECARRAGLARFLWSWRYFAEPAGA